MNNPLAKFNIRQIAKYYNKLGDDLREYKRFNKILWYDGAHGGIDYFIVMNAYTVGLAILERKLQILDKEIYRRNHLVGVL